MTSFTLFNRVRPQADVPVVAEDEKHDPETSSTGDEKQRHLDSDSEEFTPDAQDGVKNVEAITSVWTKRWLVITYIMIWIIYFVDTMQQNMTNTLTPYVTSSFGKHSLLAATSIMSSIIGGLVKLPLAKVIDIFGRPQGYLMMIVLLTVGLVMMAGCNNVQTYAAAQVFYWVGYNGLGYVLSIFIADTSKLRNRAFMFAYASSPYIATTWIGGPLAQAFLSGPGFRWGFGAFSIITPAVTLPLFFVLYYHLRKAEKLGLIKKESSAGLALFLLPFSLYSYQPQQWKSPMIISMIVFGVVFLVAFVVWEKYFAPKTFVPYHLLTDRTVLGACILAAALFVSFYIWNAFFFSFLMVVNGLTLTEASYIGNIYSIGSCLFALVVGILIRWTGRFKWLALYFGVPVTILGVGLMIHFRQPDVNIGYIIMCQIFIAFAGGTLVICEQMAAMAATSHQYVAVVIAIEGMFSSIGGAIGSAVAAAVWTGVFPVKLLELLPEESKDQAALIYGDINVQMSFPFGTPERDAINAAYGYAQKCMCIAATAVLVLALGSVMVWRDIRVDRVKQVKGVVI
ncbi:siderophore iron transporter mirB [Coprinopsis sp. MPI-PUGE-AT-0042]|nr:siderophore iron transporter mirB [Coprinopsis sp. MPI-PUGE-AT-0042]